MKITKKDLTTHEEDKIRQSLEKYIVKYPENAEVDQTIHMLRSYVPNKSKRKNSPFNRLYILCEKAMFEISIFSKSYWIVSAFLYILGYLFTTIARNDYLLMIIIITPLPFVFGLFEVFKGRESGVLELEMACKYSAYQVMLSRLLLISLYNIGLSLSLTVIISMKLAIPLWEIILIWFAPFTVFAGVSLWLSARFRQTSFIVLLISCWIIFSLFVISFESLTNLNHYILLFRQIFFLILGIFLCYQQINNIIFTYKSFDGDDHIETSY